MIFPLGEAVVKRLDIGFNILVDQPVQEYLRLLIRPNSFTDFKVGEETVEFPHKQDKLSLSFYNKVAEAFRQGKVPDPYKKQHVLYELRLRTKAPSQIGFPILRFADLDDHEVYRQFVKQWFDYYHSVSKVTDPQPKKLAF